MQSYIKPFIEAIGNHLIGPVFMVLLLGTGAFFTVYFGFPQFRFFVRAIKLLLGIEKSTNKEGDTSPFRALATSLAGSIGAGSIVGVCIVIHVGGPGTLFWMWVTAFLGMATRMAESTLSHLYREKSTEGTMIGGPMYAMQKRLNMRWLGLLFAGATLITSFFAGNIPQVNAMTGILFFKFGVSKLLSGLVISALVAAVILGGVKRIGQVTGFLVPCMTFIYLGLVTYVMIIHYDRIIPSFTSIFKYAFAPAPAIAGFVGAGLSLLILTGLQVGFFTNEAGIGSSAIAHCASQEPISGKVGIMSMLEPFIATIVMCTLTTMAVLVSGSYADKVMHTLSPNKIEVVAGNYYGDDDATKKRLVKHLKGNQKLPRYSGNITIQAGMFDEEDASITLLYNDSVIENLVVRKGKGENKTFFAGSIKVENGNFVLPTKEITIEGEALLNSQDLAVYTFANNPLGKFMSFLMILCLLLFALSTIISFSYFGDRSLVFLGGKKYLMFYKILYVGSIVFGAISEADVWSLAVITCAVMAIPNLISLFLMRKDAKKAIFSSEAQKITVK